MAFFDPQNAHLNPSDTVVTIHVALDVSVPNRGDQVRLVLAQPRQTVSLRLGTAPEEV